MRTFKKKKKKKQTRKHRRINNYTSTAPLIQSSAVSPIPPLALTVPMTSSNTSANWCCGKLFACHHAIYTVAALTPRRKRRSHVADHVFSARVDIVTIVAVIGRSDTRTYAYSTYSNWILVTPTELLTVSVDGF